MPWLGTVTFSNTGYYNATDLARENSNIQYIQEQLAANGYVIDLPYAVISPIRTDFPTVTAINNTKNNILTLIDKFYKPSGVPDIIVNTTRKQTFNYIDANTLEVNIQGLYDVLQKIIDSYRYCGTMYAGEEGLP